MADNKIAFAGDFSLTVATLMSYNGTQVDILPMIQSINIFEDLYSPFMTVNIMIEDQIGLYHKLPIVGEEILALEVTNPDGETGLKLSFSLFKTKDFLEKGPRGFIYTMCFISPEAIKDMNLKLSKAFTGTGSQIAEKLLINEGLTTDKKTYIEPSIGNLQYISNYWSPIKNFKYLCQRTISQVTKSPSYMFFENKFGFNFFSLATLKCQEPVATFSNSISAAVDSGISASLSRAEKIYIDRGIDYIKKIQNGAYGSNVVYVDPTKKSYFYRYLDFTEQFQKQPRLNEKPFGSDDATRRVNGSFDFNVTPTYTTDKMVNEYSEKWYQENIMELSSLEAFNIQIEVPGDMNLAVGKTVDFYMYTGDAPTDKNTQSTLDNVFSGRYLVTAINHTLSKDRQSMLLSLSKDSLTTKPTSN